MERFNGFVKLRPSSRTAMPLAFFLLSFYSSAISAQNLCPLNDNVAEDMRIEESEFNKHNAEQAALYLLRIVQDENTPHEWFSIPNATKFIRGYALRRKAVLVDAPSLTIDQFCQFYAEEGWYYD